MQYRHLFTATTLALSPLVHAQAVDPATELDQIVVTATRSEHRLDDSLVPAQVIDRDEIERSQATSLLELLKGRAGISLSNQGGPGKITTLNLRGTESDHVLVLVDGIRIGSATAGLPALQDLPLGQIERIEIVRGPRSSLYGSDAIGGVLQIFTRRANGFAPHLELGAGSHGLRQLGGGFGNGGERGWFGVHAAQLRTDGINACRGSGTLFTGCYTDEPDEDGYRNTSVSVNAGLRLSDSLSVEGRLLDARAENEYDGSWTNRSDTVQQATGVRMDWQALPALKLGLSVGRSRDQSDDYHDNTYISTFDTRRDQAGLQADIALGRTQSLSLGADWLRDDIESTTAYAADSRDNTGVFALYQGRFGVQQLQASLRHDDNEQFGGHTTGGVGWGLQFGDGWRLSADYSTGFRAPSFNDLYDPWSGVPTLDPETSESVNLGIGQQGNSWQWRLDAYQTDVDDLISYNLSTFVLEQVEQARIRGAELTLSLRLADWEISTQLSHTDPRNRTSGSANYDKLLPRRARDTGRIDIDRAFGKLRLGATLFGSGERYDDAANSVRLGGYATFDLRAEYAFAPGWSVQARANNVFDRQYETIAWYNQPGREYGINLRYQPAR
ncbi:TonB-dependent vitamin B12 receptor [Pseudoxanthomonas kalamensis DSM 18571]|uniref:TonB-dependent vitamin B12 receptor n=1 Tax=Pseudoxanthomonas kalamensis TaxID=289483 RepID=UPI0013919573|nr:TonB-dependent vitamin B12 receptor [Pseudoxanthomonas kalamensis]KAF1712707.1 TonB-dependent vitamin B12 receptor [Pseudoxanthomonas kalamensis DSM 18571]